uniref:TonB-dependent receptor, plug n=1 Tax=Solibacter usitatus (strain Ellin6076) TaxID=234267 RepID=Q01YS8_SOLUE
MKVRLCAPVLPVFLLMLAAALHCAFAQGGVTTALTGTVFDSSGAIVPGANIVAKNKATASSSTAVSGADGLFTIPALEPGNYDVTVAIKGFATAVLEDIRLNAGAPSNIKAVLTPGGVAETVVVESAGEILKTTQTSVTTTLTQQQLTSLPLPGRAAFDLITFLPGVTTADGTSRGAMVNGLPTSTVNITLDGMNIQDNYAKTWDGMFTRVSPRLDAVEEVTIGTAAQGADMAGQGGVQIKMVTRSGTNEYHGSVYYYLRRDWMNSNTWFNLHRNVDINGNPTSTPVSKQFQPGGRLGGPVRIPKLFNGRDKLFFFVNYEWVSSPGTSTSTRTIMSPLSEQGIFQYAGGANVDLMAMAARNGQVARIDPLVAKMLGDVRKSTSITGVVNSTTDPLTQSFVWQQPTTSKTTFPTVRVDYNVTAKHRLTGSITQNHLISDPDTTNSVQAVYPGFPVHGLQDSTRYTGQGAWRSTLSSRIVNEFRFGKTGGATQFSPDLTSDMFAGAGLGAANGYAISWSGFKSIANPYPASANSSREGKTMVFEDSLNWVKGRHLLSMGVSYTKAEVWLYNQTKAPVLTLGMTSSGDPADSMFTTANFPGASSTDITNARNLYAVLTGRVSAITRNARIQPDGSTYKILGASDQYGTLPEWGSFINDSWHAKPNVTVNAGLRYDVQRPFYAQNNSYSTATLDDIFGVTGVGSGFEPGSVVNNLGNLFKPGALQGAPTTFKMLTKNSNAYHTDWGGFAPSLGAAWTVGADSGFLHAVLGSKGNSVLRGGASLAYQRGGMSDFTGVFGSNPGISIDASRNQTNGNLGAVPVLLSSSDLGPPAINLTRAYPMAVPSASSSVYVFDPNIKTPSAFSYNLSWQRQLARNLTIEGRFIHTNSFNTWTAGGQLPYLDYNEINILENGFLPEFKLAQANLQANIAAGKGSTFAYTGVAGTSPLPIFLAYLNGAKTPADATKYTGTGWTNTTVVQSMYPLNPNPYTAASNIWANSAYRTNGLAAGYPSNFWVANPDINHGYVVTNGPKTSYNGVQVSLNRRFSDGLLFELNYTYGRGYMDQFYGFHKPYVNTEMNYTNINTNQNGNATGNVRHVFVGNWMYQLPFGKNKHFLAGAGGLLDRVVGGWSFQGVGRLQSGRMLDFGNVRLNGMTPDDVRSAFKMRQVTDPQNPYRTLIYMLPQDIIDNTIKAFSVGATGYTNGAPTGRYFAPANSPSCIESVNGFGDCGLRSLIVTGPKVLRFDFNLIKQIRVTERLVLEGQAQVFNVFNNVNFNPVNYVGSVSDSYQVTGAVDQSRTMQLAFRISF